MKKYISVLMFLLILVFFTIACAQDSDPEAFTFGDWEAINNDNGLTLTAYHGASDELEIPAAFDDKKVTQIGKELFKNNTTIRKVNIPDSVTVIDNGAFSGCTALEEVHLPSLLKKINNSVFRYCINLERIDIPFTVTIVDALAFADCLKLKEAVLLSVTTLGESAFDNCSSLSSVIVSRKLTSVGVNVFRDTEWLNSQTDEFVFIGNDILIKWNGSGSIVEVPYGTTVITGAFEGKIQIEEVRLPETIRMIGQYAFRDASNLRSVNIPPYVERIAYGAFQNCGSLTTVNLPVTIKDIAGSAFRNCTHLTRFTFPPQITTINANVLANCPALTEVLIPRSVKTINENAFANSPSVHLQVSYDSEAERFAVEHDIPYSYEMQESGDFLYTMAEDGIKIVRYLGRMPDVEIPAEIDGIRVTGVSTAAFQSNNRVKRIIVPLGVKEIGDWAFSYMDSLEYVQLPTTLTTLGSNSFSGTGSIEQIRLPEGIQMIGISPFDTNGNTTLCAGENSITAELLRAMGYQVQPENMCSDDLTMTELWGKFNNSDTCDCDCNGGSGEIGYSGSTNANYLDYQIIRVPNGISSLTKDLLDNSKKNVLIIVPSSVTSISDEIVNEHSVIIVGEAGSVAESFARAHDLRFLVWVKAWLDLS